MATASGPACPLCSVESRLIYEDIPDYRYDDTPDAYFDVYRCPSCDLFITDTGTADLGNYYPSHYSAHHADDFGIDSFPIRAHDVYVAWTRRRFGIDVMAAIEAISEDGRVLDVGCGAGGLLADCRERGYDVAGCDVSRTAAETAADRYGLEVRVGRLPDLDYAAESFDVIIYNHSLEHVEQPVEYAKETARICAPGGHLLVNVPNVLSFERRMFGRYWADLDVPRHVYHWHPGAIDLLFDEPGFVPVDRRFSRSPRTLAHSISRTISETVGVTSPTPVVFDPVCLPLSLVSGTVGVSSRFLSSYRFPR